MHYPFSPIKWSIIEDFSQKEHARGRGWEIEWNNSMIAMIIFMCTKSIILFIYIFIFWRGRRCLKKDYKLLHITSFVSGFSCCIDISGLQYLEPKGPPIFETQRKIWCYNLWPAIYASCFSACKYKALRILNLIILHMGYANQNE